MKIGMISPAMLPIPAVKGGAVESLMQVLIDENEKNGLNEFIIYSNYDKEAIKKSEKYKYTKFIYTKRTGLKYIICRLMCKIKRIFIKDFNQNAYTYLVMKDIETKKIDKLIIQANVYLILALNKKIDKKNIVLHLHSDALNTELSTKLNKKNITTKVDTILCVSEFIKKQTLKNIEFEADKIKVLKNCVDISKFNAKNYINYREKFRDKYDINDEEIVIMFTGRILEIKGVKELIQAFKKVNDRINAKLLIVGNAGFGNSIKTSYDKELMDLTRGIEDKIIFTGFIHNDDLPKIHAGVDIAVVPSIWDEPAGLVVIEAMASGLPLIVTDSGGISEYTTHEGCITIQRDSNLVNNISEALEALSLDYDLRKEMGRKNQEYVKQFNTKRYYENFINELK